MASINYLVKGKKTPATIYCRFINTKHIDITIPTGLFIDPKNWDIRNQKIKNVIAIKNRDEINKKLALFKIELLDVFNLDFANGVIIDKYWLENQVKLYFNRPKKEHKAKNQNHTIYYYDFAKWWLDNKASKWLTSDNSYMTKRVKGQYAIFTDKILDYEGGKKIKLTDDLHSVITDFVHFLSDNDYASSTISRNIKRFKFFCNRANSEGFKIDTSYNNRVFIPKQVEVLEPYLSPEELIEINKLKFEPNDPLGDVRDSTLIGCYTGLRISDFNNKLDISNFIDDFIEIVNTKTKARVSIPVHPVIKKILIKRNGCLPKKTSDSDFNEKIKRVCELAGINEFMEGRLKDPVKNRKVHGKYEKYKLVSSHICRRSFVTNHFGIIPNGDLMKIGGWTTLEMMTKYLKKTSREYGKSLIEVWSKDEKLNELLNGR